MAPLASASVAPAVTNAALTAEASLIRAPSTPIVTTWPMVTNGAPSAPRMAARVGQVSRSMS